MVSTQLLGMNRAGVNKMVSTQLSEMDKMRVNKMCPPSSLGWTKVVLTKWCPLSCPRWTELGKQVAGAATRYPHWGSNSSCKRMGGNMLHYSLFVGP